MKQFLNYESYFTTVNMNTYKIKCCVHSIGGNSGTSSPPPKLLFFLHLSVTLKELTLFLVN